MTERLFALNIKLQFVPKLGILSMEGFFAPRWFPFGSWHQFGSQWKLLTNWTDSQSKCADQCLSQSAALCTTVLFSFPLWKTSNEHIGWRQSHTKIKVVGFFLADVCCRYVCLFSIIIRLDLILFRQLHLFPLSQTALYHYSGVSMEILWMRGFYLWGSGL